ncbi:exonuclease III [Pseudoalteromonas sp. BZK2]|uniref:exonuclease III n=1 Tax=Pseudoalteromonas sp. BZK2 TaxID=1904458 RepID=UPI0016543BFD|nr:exonuclease III [Pseudoalteromonas sp. BZK2]MBC7009104.1 exonuclease III [Pseudoalteromonas sp. BZK2]
MKKQLVMLSLACISFGSLASNPHYFSADNSIESKLCSLSANEGFTAARKEAAKHGISMSRFSKSILCNGTDIREIAKKAQSQEVVKAAVEVFAKNEQKETQLCITALKKGLTPVREKIGNLNTLKCNGEAVTDFVKRYQNAAI